MVDCYLYFHLVCSVIGLIFERLISTRRQPRLPPISRVIRFYQFNCLFSPLLTNSFKLANNVMSLNGYTHSKYIIAFNRQVICLGVPRIALGIMNILPNLDRYWYFSVFVWQPSLSIVIQLILPRGTLRSPTIFVAIK